ncbi:MAG TPA: hypothetical protein DCX17_02555 [Firmicutes bacterium]|jgi:tRNA nucleotidyltransferase/poly(A) polymerase|nr:hypothetical protein [Bacillota bacterium]
MELSVFTDLATLFHKNGFRLYLIGGTSRDYLLNLPIDDFDMVTDATPANMETFLHDADYRFAHYGNVKLRFNNHKIDITTLRQESGYKDYRHPQSIQFVSAIEQDYARRDFTINALYIDSDMKIYDFADGLAHLKEKRIVMIGEPYLRIQEDPLRILRALRFHMRLGFDIDEPLKQAIIHNIDMLAYITPAKVNAEINKMLHIDEEQTKHLLNSFGIQEAY